MNRRATDTVRDVWEPVGPLPAAVYWRRRCLAVASAVLVVLVLVWACASAFAPATRPVTATPAAATAPQPAPSSPVSPAPGTGGPLTTPRSVLTPLEQPVVPPLTSSEVVVPDETPREPVPVPPSVAPPPTGPVPCTDGVLGVSAEVDPPEHRVGERPVLRLVVVNLGAEPCVRDLDGARQEIVVWSGDGALRLWSSNDCVNPATVDLRTLVPGRPVAFAVRWAGRTSEPGCARARTGVPAGTYRVMTRLDDVVSPPVPMVRNP